MNCYSHLLFHPSQPEMTKYRFRSDFNMNVGFKRTFSMVACGSFLGDRVAAVGSASGPPPISFIVLPEAAMVRFFNTS